MYGFSKFYKIMTYICIAILAYFLTDTLNWLQVLWRKEKYLLVCMKNWKNKVSLKQI